MKNNPQKALKQIATLINNNDFIIDNKNKGNIYLLRQMVNTLYCLKFSTKVSKEQIKQFSKELEKIWCLIENETQYIETH